MIDQEIHLTIDTGIIPTKRIEAIQIVKINDIKIIDQENVQTIDQIINDPNTTIIKLDHEIGTQVITKDKETFPSHLTAIIHVILILKTNIEVINKNIKDRYIKYKQQKKQIQTPLVSIVQKALNYN